ncbi:hypothetical protein ACP0HM_34740 [Escherichia coli]
MRRYELRLAKIAGTCREYSRSGCDCHGGGMSNVDRLYQTVGQLIKQFVFGGECETPVRKGESTVIPAAYAALRGYGHKSKKT